MPLNVENFRSPKILSCLAIIPLAGITLVNIFYLLLGFCEIVFLRDIEMGNDSAFTAWQALIYLIWWGEFVLKVAASMFFLIWLYRIFKNMPSLKVRKSEYSPGWAIGFWFIPIANLFKPYQIVQQAWRDSDPDCDPELNYVDAKPIDNSFILVWWITLVISAFALRLFNRLAETVPIKYYWFAMMILSTITGAAYFMSIVIVKEITERQDKRAKTLLSSTAYTPPSPPAFD